MRLNLEIVIKYYNFYQLYSISSSQFMNLPLSYFLIFLNCPLLILKSGLLLIVINWCCHSIRNCCSTQWCFSVTRTCRFMSLIAYWYCMSSQWSSFYPNILMAIGFSWRSLLKRCAFKSISTYFGSTRRTLSIIFSIYSISILMEAAPGPLISTRSSRMHSTMFGTKFLNSSFWLRSLLILISH